MGKAKPRLVLENIGPIRHADVSLADLTVLVGPQATGKSLLIQFLKLAFDHLPITRTLRSHGLDWNPDGTGFLDVYLGRGMSSVWSSRGTSKSWIQWNGAPLQLEALASGRQQGRGTEQSLVVPAQRVLAFSSQSWLRPFSDFRAGDPYSIRAFSEHLRVQIDSIFNPRKRVWGLDPAASALLKQSLFGKFEPAIEVNGSQKELVLSNGKVRKSLPFMVWSAGQREFVPLWLTFVWLLPAGASLRKQSCEWVIIEEPEMGLHPKAIAAILFVVVELLQRGYRVCLSTHSTHVLDLVWAFNILKETGAPPDTLLDIFGVRPDRATKRLAKDIWTKETAVYYFDDESGNTHDISSLDLDGDDPRVKDWGKLTQFTTSIGDIVATQVANGSRK